MGRLTEYFSYLNENPKGLSEKVKEFSYITIDDNIKKQRSRLKLYNVVCK